MAKNLLQDMVKVKKAREKIRIPAEELPTGGVKQVKGQVKKPRYKIWLVAIISITFFIFAVSYLFTKAVVTVNPKTKELVLNQDLSASKDSATEGLSFDLVVISGEENKTLKADSEKDVKEVATGTVVIYNAFGYSPQPLSIDTRLTGSNGKIYKTKTKTVVPGMKKDGIPGSVEVKIYASVAGAEYNSMPLDFQIFGFKGTPKYSKIYARSKGEITGGFVGKAPVVSDADKAQAISDLKTTLQNKLLKNATNQIPTGFVLFKNAILLNTNNVNNEPNISSIYNKDNSLTLKLKGTLEGILLDEQKLTKKITEKDVAEYSGSQVYVSNLRDLNFSMSNGDTNISNDTKNINFNLSGSAKVVWKLDETKLVNDLLGKSKKDFSQILLQYPGVDSADVVTTPFWRTSLPDKSKDIQVIVNYQK